MLHQPHTNTLKSKNGNRQSINFLNSNSIQQHNLKDQVSHANPRKILIFSA